MSKDATLILDLGGKIVWANRVAHENVGLKPGGLLGKNYLDFCPIETHADLLRLHKLKIEGETVRFRIDIGGGKVLSVTSGPVRIEDRLYMYVVGRRADGPPDGDEVLVGMVAAGAMLHEKRQKADLNSLLVGALKDEARTLVGKLSLLPGAPPAVRVLPWSTKMVIRRLLLAATQAGPKFTVSTGGGAGRAWLKITLPRAHGAASKELAACRRIMREQGGRLNVRGRTVLLSFPAV
jgi:hypothetical protein